MDTPTFIRRPLTLLFLVCYEINRKQNDSKYLQFNIYFSCRNNLKSIMIFSTSHSGGMASVENKVLSGLFTFKMWFSSIPKSKKIKKFEAQK